MAIQKRVTKKATPRFELGIRILQTPALPLGHVALDYSIKLSVKRIKSNVKVSRTKRVKMRPKCGILPLVLEQKDAVHGTEVYHRF